MPRFLPRRRLWQVVLGAVVVLVGVGIAALVIVLDRPGNVSHPDLQFTAPTAASAPTSPGRRAEQAQDRFAWPWYGYTAGRTRDFVAPPDLRPPLHVGWQYNGTSLLEFPPSIAHRTLFFLDDDAVARALSVRTGKVVWKRRVGTLAAASPAIAALAGVVLMPVLSDHGHSPGAGRFVALSMRTGRQVWSRPIASGSESSPIVSGHTVYYGDSGGTLSARDVRTGHLDWTYHAGAAIKGGPAIANGILYFGDYAGRAYAVRASDGHRVWAVSTSGAQFGLGSGNFYATPAVAYGRVYMGSTDGRVYSFGARTGALAWATATGGYVYASAAVADPRGLGPTLFVGSYDGDLYAFNAQSGKVRWRHAAGGRISGSATVIGDVVYFADLGTRRTAGLDVDTGHQVFDFADGAFTPVVADERAIYLVGYGNLYQLLPGSEAAARRARARRRAAAAHRRGRHAPRRTAPPRRRRRG